jgi:hypothetical protein
VEPEPEPERSFPSGTGTEMHSGSESVSKINGIQKSKTNKNERPVFWETVLLLSSNIENQSLYKFLVVEKTVLDIVCNRNRNPFSKVGTGTAINHRN